MKRKIIRIDREVCNGCGQCLPNCPEGALQLIDGKARLVSDLFCDGLGACIGTCPLGAIHVEEREAEPYDERRVMANIAPQGANVIQAHLEHLAAHNETAYLEQARQFLHEQGVPLPETKREEGEKYHGCPGSQTQDRRGQEPARSAAVPASATTRPSELRTWPVQLQLLNPQASFFDNADLLIAADCVPFAHASFHEDFVTGRIPIIFCPKLDHAGEQYLEKLAAILTLHPVRSLHVVHMEVPCCSGTTALVAQALARSGKDIPVHDYTISIQGKLLAVK
ncbi:MAG: 4Fe-4S binding protein [Acidobacteria bacterium]|nr:4Fe-4S binding protein [Acidobacteriota bacterium]